MEGPMAYLHGALLAGFGGLRSCLAFLKWRWD
jgi:hypothetical protein